MIRKQPNQPPVCCCGEIGRRKGLKIPRWQHRAGSSPAAGTRKSAALARERPIFGFPDTPERAALQARFSAACAALCFCEAVFFAADPVAADLRGLVIFAVSKVIRDTVRKCPAYWDEAFHPGYVLAMVAPRKPNHVSSKASIPCVRISCAFTFLRGAALCARPRRRCSPARS